MVVVKKIAMQEMQISMDQQAKLLEAAVTEGTRQFNETHEDIIKLHADVNAFHRSRRDRSLNGGASAGEFREFSLIS